MAHGAPPGLAPPICPLLPLCPQLALASFLDLQHGYPRDFAPHLLLVLHLSVTVSPDQRLSLPCPAQTMLAVLKHAHKLADSPSLKSWVPFPLPSSVGRLQDSPLMETVWQKGCLWLLRPGVQRGHPFLLAHRPSHAPWLSLSLSVRTFPAQH